MKGLSGFCNWQVVNGYAINQDCRDFNETCTKVVKYSRIEQ
jgi:hypothetical protein